MELTLQNAGMVLYSIKKEYTQMYKGSVKAQPMFEVKNKHQEI